MKSFFEEYGFVILAAIVVILLIAMCTPIGNLVKSQITGIVDSFANKTNTKLNAVDAGENTAYLRKGADGKLMIDISSGNSTDEFSYVVLYTAGGQAASKSIAKNKGPISTALTYDTKTPDVGTSVQVKVTNEGTSEVFYSNSVVFSADCKA